MFAHRRICRPLIVMAMAVGLVAVPAVPVLAGSSHVSFTFATAPVDVTAGDNGLAKAVFMTFDTSATHAVLTVVAPVGVASALQLPSGCTLATSTTGTTFTCNLGIVGPNTTVRTLIPFQTPDCSTTPSCPPLTLSGSVTFAEGNTNKGSDTLGPFSSTLQIFPIAAKATVNGHCATATATSPATLGTQASSTTLFGMQTTFGPAADSALPCTPGIAGVQRITLTDTSLHYDRVFFVQLPTLSTTSNNGLATVSVTISDLSNGVNTKGVNAHNFQLQEYVGDIVANPSGFDQTHFPVPACVNGQIPLPANGITYDSCVSGQSRYGSGGVVVFLLIRPTGADPGYCD